MRSGGCHRQVADLKRGRAGCPVPLTASRHGVIPDDYWTSHQLRRTVYRGMDGCVIYEIYGARRQGVHPAVERELGVRIGNDRQMEPQASTDLAVSCSDNKAHLMGLELCTPPPGVDAEVHGMREGQNAPCQQRLNRLSAES